MEQNTDKTTKRIFYRRIGFVAGFVASALAVAVAGSARAELLNGAFIDRNGNTIGSVTIKDSESGYVHVLVGVGNIPQGPHGFHVHEVGECDPQTGFESAGGHLAGDRKHGIQSAEGPHPGDFPNVNASADNRVVTEFFTEKLSISGGENPLMDDDGSAIIIHSGPDDYSSQPSGDAGERIACAVLQNAE